LIAIVSYPEDPHALAVIEHLRAASTPVTLLDLSDLPDRATLSIAYDHDRPPTLEYKHREEPLLDLRTVRAIWWRRPQAADPAAIADPDVRLFAANEWQEAINGVWQLLEARWVNDPVRDDVAARKALQLRMAADVGLSVPRTLVTSDPKQARAFIEARDGTETIFKTFSCTHEIWRETRLVREDELDLLETVRLAPVITAAIHWQATDYPIDFRMSLGQAEVEPATVPAVVEERLLELMDRLGLSYGAIDMRRTPSGEHVFLELNTAGEFLFIEDLTRQPIARSLAELLAA
jgi:glutathione synthase/RimK-type ligase-like ATP-grasp enzyme